MSAPALSGGRLQDRIVVFFVGLLMAVQAVSFFSMRYLIDRTAQDTLREELRTGGRVFQRLQQQTAQRLVESAVVLTSDFAFRGAIASNDRETIDSVLRNHAGRVNATGVSLVNLNGVVVTDTLNARRRGARTRARSWWRSPTASAAPRASACWRASRTNR